MTRYSVRVRREDMDLRGWIDDPFTVSEFAKAVQTMDEYEPAEVDSAMVAPDWDPFKVDES